MPPGPGAWGRVGAGTWFACKTQQELFGQLVLVGRAESLWGLSSQHGGMFSCTGVPRFLKRKAFALEYHFFSMCVSLPAVTKWSPLVLGRSFCNICSVSCC